MEEKNDSSIIDITKLKVIPNDLNVSRDRGVNGVSGEKAFELWCKYVQHWMPTDMNKLSPQWPNYDFRVDCKIGNRNPDYIISVKSTITFADKDKTKWRLQLTNDGSIYDKKKSDGVFGYFPHENGRFIMIWNEDIPDDAKILKIPLLKTLSKEKQNLFAQDFIIYLEHLSKEEN